MEKLFINNNFSYVRLIPLNNGSGWTTASLCQRIATTFSILNIQPDAIVVWLDKEKQKDPIATMRQAIFDALVEKGAEAGKIHICIPDRMTENIILADEVVIQKEFSQPAYAYSCEGKNGKHILTGMYAEIGPTYRETFHGVMLMKKIRLRRASTVSQTVAQFVEKLSLPCWWLN